MLGFSGIDVSLDKGSLGKCILESISQMERATDDGFVKDLGLPPGTEGKVLYFTSTYTNHLSNNNTRFIDNYNNTIHYQTLICHFIMNWRPLPWWSRMHFHEYRCIVCNSVLRVHPSQNSVTEYVPTDRCYNCNYEISYSLATHDETSSQQFLQTRLPLVQAAEQIADELAEASTPL